MTSRSDRESDTRMARPTRVDELANALPPRSCSSRSVCSRASLATSNHSRYEVRVWRHVAVLAPRRSRLKRPGRLHRETPPTWAPEAARLVEPYDAPGGRLSHAESGRVRLEPE